MEFAIFRRHITSIYLSRQQRCFLMLIDFEKIYDDFLRKMMVTSFLYDFISIDFISLYLTSLFYVIFFDIIFPY